ncbi:MAG: DUF4124 domain-containing protein [Neisseriaceae bacterium]|nr:DUF4124 domain-containing protein [Neisseriaceae bacterium]
MKKMVLALAVLVATSAFAENVYSWRDSKGMSYSDTPRALRTVGVSEFNVRTHTSQSLRQENAAGQEIQLGADGKEKSLAEQQLELAKKVAERNAQIEAENKRRIEESKKDNCRISQMNLKSAQSANRMANREEAIAGYERDVAKYCN